MTRFLLDTGIAADFINRRHGVYERSRLEASKGNRVGICVPVLAELYYGAHNSATPERNRQRVRLAASVWLVWPFTADAAEEFGRLAAEMRRVGRPMQQVDLMIAAIARTLGDCVVVTTDSD